MRFQQNRQRRISFAGILSILLFLVMLLAFRAGISSITRDSEVRQKEQLEQALKKAVTYCYASEGAYPDDLEHLQKVYGLHWDTSLFYVGYRSNGANIYPDITIIEQNGEAAE